MFGELICWGMNEGDYGSEGGVRFMDFREAIQKGGLSSRTVKPLID